MKAAEDAGNNHYSPLMKDPITMEEVKDTFHRNKGAHGTDRVTASLLDRADRETTKKVLNRIWNLAWKVGSFPAAWKLEHRAIFQKGSDIDSHQENGYRTVSLKSIIGKRFESITSKRLFAIMEGLGFDPNQYAYLTNRSSTGAAMIVAEQIKRGLMNNSDSGVIFFDFSDAFGGVNRKNLLLKINKDFGITGKVFLHLHDFLSNRHTRIKVGDIT